MRRRRRPPTRIIKRNNSFDPNLTFQKKQEGRNGKSFLKFLLWIIVIAVISYFTYTTLYSTGGNEKTAENNLENTDSVSTESETINESTFKQPEKMIQIEVLNGCGVSGIAKIFESYLRQNGFDVVNTENYRILGKINWNLQNSKVIDQVGKFENAEAVAQSLGIDEKYVLSNDNPSPICDVTVVIGKDFKQVKGFKEFSK